MGDGGEGGGGMHSVVVRILRPFFLVALFMIMDSILYAVYIYIYTSGDTGCSRQNHFRLLSHLKVALVDSCNGN